MQDFAVRCLPESNGRVLIVALILFAGLTVGLSGCGEPRKPAGSVAGRVTLGGEPVSQANVQLFQSDGTPAGVAAVDASGQFRFEQAIPTGRYEVAVLSAAEVAPAGSDPSGEQRAASIPPKYWDQHTSGLTAKIEEGENSLVLELE